MISTSIARRLIGLALCSLLCAACQTSRRLAGRSPEEGLLTDSALVAAQVGISVYDATAGRFLYRHQDEKYFLPASNTKLFSLFAGMKYLGDSLPAFWYMPTDTAFFLLPAGDPTLLHPDFADQPGIDMLRKAGKKIYISDYNWQEEAWGAGWSWDDYNDEYMVERSVLPVYGNIIRWTETNPVHNRGGEAQHSSPSIYSIPEVSWKVHFLADTSKHIFYVRRKMDENVFALTEGDQDEVLQTVPFITHGLASALELLRDTLAAGQQVFAEKGDGPMEKAFAQGSSALRLLHSRPVDSMFRPMMYHSDNFFAEQTLLMVSQQLLGKMNDQQIIERLLSTDLKGLPQKPRWVDGSGLSRYNLFSPADFVWLLQAIQEQFGLERLERLLPTGGFGKTNPHFKSDSGFIYAKSGSLSDVLNLSGYLITPRQHLLIFSLLVNHYFGREFRVRRAMEAYLHEMRISH